MNKRQRKKNNKKFEKLLKFAFKISEQLRKDLIIESLNHPEWNIK